MVPPNWEHPQRDTAGFVFGRYEKSFQPMRNRPFIEDMDAWISEYTLWREGNHPDQLSGEAEGYEEYIEWGGNPPQPEYYRPNWKPEEMTWYQVFENVSEGTPVTPPFATREELVEYLVEYGDFWHQMRRKENVGMPCKPWARDYAYRFVFKDGFALTSDVISR